MIKLKWQEINNFESVLKKVLCKQAEEHPLPSMENIIIKAIDDFNKYRNASEVALQKFFAPDKHRESFYASFCLKLRSQTWSEAEQFSIYINPKTFVTYIVIT